MSSPPGSELQRVLRAPDAIAIIVTNMVGVGILTTPSYVARDLGSPVFALIAWGLGGALSLAGALVHAELGCRYPQAGGDYVFIREAFGRCAGFMSGWSTFVIGFPAAIALACLLSADAIHDAVGWQKSGWALLALATVLLLSISLVHSAGLRWGKRVQNVLALLEVATLLTLVVGGWFFASPSLASGAPPNPAAGKGFGSAALSIYFAYTGWNAAAYVAGEIREPRRNLPLALVCGVLLVTGLYIAVNATYFRLVAPEDMGRTLNVGTEVARQVFGPRGGQVLSLALACIVVGTASSMVITGPRVYYAMAKDGLFPRALSRVGPSSHAPLRALWLQSFWALLILWCGLEPQEIISWTIFVLLPFAALTTASVFVFRRRDTRTGESPPFRVPGYPILPALIIGAAAAVLTIFAIHNPYPALIGSALAASGLPVYFLWTRLARGPRVPVQPPGA